MLKANNIFHEESLEYKKTGKVLGERQEELNDLQDICDYCSVNDEKIEYDICKFYDAYVEPDVTLSDWLFVNKGNAGQDVRDYVLSMLDSFTDYKMDTGRVIDISLGKYQDYVYDEKGYRDKRRSYLSEMHNIGEFTEFMGSCFINSVFSEDVKNAMRKIPDFGSHTEEIVDNLALLNDEAIAIYKKHRKNAKEAMKELASKAKDCSGDPKHKDLLKFPFPYEVKENGENRTYIVEISCSPHLKLIRKDSNLRIYFYWYDERISEGKKVLIGRIGGHPY